MRLIYEPDIERQDFIELIITPEEYEQLQEGGIVAEFKDGLRPRRLLNVHVRVDSTYEEG